MKYGAFIVSLLGGFLITENVHAAELKANDPAPLFVAKTHDGKDFDLKSRKGQWTVLYFYPKAGTPGCTKQACAFRDNIEKIRAQGADVFGVSADTVQEQAEFHKTHHLNFTLLADPEDKIINMYGSKMPMMKMSKRWTFVIDPELKIRTINKDVDPVVDSEKIAEQISQLKAKK
ncbi:peroxiredoxin [Bdellovibrio sp. HCB337]|uniref:peroxiredoxin n=1 Tax=Bdellovibrio sp. HCB337 TaxID=3394358 RepID=UPI0039A78293